VVSIFKGIRGLSSRRAEIAMDVHSTNVGIPASPESIMQNDGNMSRPAADAKDRAEVLVRHLNDFTAS
jgi:hypothetical protein